MYESIKFKLKGVCPLLMHNGQLADPLNPIVREMKKLTAKRNKKTDDDMMQLAKLEFMGGLYLDDDGHPCIPGEVVEAMLVSSARATRNGKKFTASIMCDGNFKVDYDGPKDAEGLWDSGKFRDTRGVKVTTSRVMRTRPIFRNWKMACEVQFLPSMVNRAEVVDTMTQAGMTIGLCDYRPKFGRFTVEEAK